MLDSDAANVSFPIQIKQCVFIQVPGFCNLSGLELDVERVGVLEILDFHALNERSKKAL